MLICLERIFVGLKAKVDKIKVINVLVSEEVFVVFKANVDKIQVWSNQCRTG